MWPPDHPQASRLESELFLSACERNASLLFWQIQVVMNTARNAPAAAAKRIESLPRVNKTTKTLYMMWRHYEMHDLICLTRSITTTALQC